MLENRHVPADFVDAAQRGDPKTARSQRTRWGEVYIHLWTMLWLDFRLT
jgi:hypothetical protein